MFTNFNLLAVSILVPSDLDKCLGLGLALLLYLHPAEVLGDNLQLGGALVMISVITMITRVMIKMNTTVRCLILRLRVL